MATTVGHTVLNDGNKMPLIGLGTWQAEKGVVGEAVKTALELGYRSFDFAPVYGNEKEIGVVLEHIRGALDKTLKDLQVTYLDLYLIHWPIALEFTGYDLSDPTPKDKDGNAKLAKVSIRDTWQELEKLKDEGIVKSLGISNFTAREIADLLSYARITPAVNQIEISPRHTRQPLVQFCQRQGIHVTSYTTLGSVYTHAGALEIQSIKDLAKKYNKSPAQIVLHWATQLGISVIPKSTNNDRLKQNIDSCDFTLSDEDIKVISDENQNCSAFPPQELPRFFGFPLWD